MGCLSVGPSLVEIAGPNNVRPVKPFGMAAEEFWAVWEFQMM